MTNDILRLEQASVADDDSLISESFQTDDEGQASLPKAKQSNLKLICLALHRSLRIRTTSVFYQLWKVVQIILSFVSSFQYAYFVVFFEQMSDSQRTEMENLDIFYMVMFSLDLLAHAFVDRRRPGQFQKIDHW